MRLTTVLLACCLTFGSLAFAQTPKKEEQKHSPDSTASASDVPQGKKLFGLQCAVCHYSASRAKKIGPGLKGLAKRGTFADGKAVDDASLRAWIEKGGKNMPGFKDSLSAEQVRELIAYLKTL